MGLTSGCIILCNYWLVLAMTGVVEWKGLLQGGSPVSSLSCQIQHNQLLGLFLYRGGGGWWSVIDNYEKQRGKTTDNQIHIITAGKNQCYTSEKLTDVILIGFLISKYIISSLIYIYMSNPLRSDSTCGCYETTCMEY